MINFRCLFGHIWIAIKVAHYRDASYMKSGVPSTTVTFQCERCGEIKSEDKYGVGYLELSDFIK